jgi:cold shock CspA family protein
MRERYKPLEHRSTFGPRPDAARRFEGHEAEAEIQRNYRPADPEPVRAPDERIEGYITKLMDGCGFIRGEDDVVRFFHKSGLDSNLYFPDLAVNDTVSFLHIEAPKGPRAIEVRRSRRGA